MEDWNVLQLKSTVPESRHKTFFFCKLQLISTLLKRVCWFFNPANPQKKSINNTHTHWAKWDEFEKHRARRESSSWGKKILLDFTMKLFMPINNVVRPENGFSWSFFSPLSQCCWLALRGRREKVHARRHCAKLEDRGKSSQILSSFYWNISNNLLRGLKRFFSGRERKTR